METILTLRFAGTVLKRVAGNPAKAVFVAELSCSLKFF